MYNIIIHYVINSSIGCISNLFFSHLLSKQQSGHLFPIVLKEEEWACARTIVVTQKQIMALILDLVPRRLSSVVIVMHPPQDFRHRGTKFWMLALRESRVRVRVRVSSFEFGFGLGFGLGSIIIVVCRVVCLAFRRFVFFVMSFVFWSFALLCLALPSLVRP
jgi:hypothetical protein